MKRTTLTRSLMSSSRNRSWNRGPHVLPNPKKRLKIRVRDPESAKLSNQPTRKMTTRLRWRHLDPDVCAKFDEDKSEESGSDGGQDDYKPDSDGGDEPDEEY